MKLFRIRRRRLKPTKAEFNCYIMISTVKIAKIAFKIHICFKSRAWKRPVKRTM